MPLLLVMLSICQRLKKLGHQVLQASAIMPVKEDETMYLHWSAL